MTALLPFYAGLRLGEVVALNVEDVQLHRWITQERQGCLGAEGPALLLNYRGERLSARGAHNALTTIAEQVGIDDLTAHVLGLPDWQSRVIQPSPIHASTGRSVALSIGGAVLGAPPSAQIMIDMNVRYDEVLDPLRQAYDTRAAWRDGLTKEPWKLAERQAFRDRLASGARLLEIGAGTGQDSAFFQQEGLDVVAADLSPLMVEHCRAKGIEAHVMDFLHLDFPPGSFDAVFAMNCLLHVPNHDLPAVLAAIRAVLRPGGLFFVGVYGGSESAEGPIDDDQHVPPRFFSWRTDEQLLGFAAAARFDVVDFHPVDTGRGYRFQSLTLRRPNGD